MSEQSSTFGFVGATAAGAISAGLGVIILTLLAVEVLRSSTPAPSGAALYLLFGGTLAGILVAGATAWRLLAPIESAYRRGGLAMVSAFATVVIMLICIPVHQLFGRAGLLALLVVCVLVSVVSWRLARRAFRPA